MFYSAQEITTGQHYAAQKAFSELSQTIPFRDAFKKKNCSEGDIGPFSLGCSTMRIQHIQGKTWFHP